jgi:two-component system sensor histidine kinase BaeS
MSIQKKLILIFLAFSMTLIVSMALLIKWSFHSGFEAYIKEQNQARLEQISERLAEHYRDRGSWSALHNDPRMVRTLVQAQRSPSTADPATTPPPSHHPQERIPLHLLYLLDARKAPVLGRVPTRITVDQLTPVSVNQKVVGYVGFNYKNRHLNSRDERFARQQGQQLLLISAAAILLSIAFAWPVSHLLIKRLQRLGQQIRRLSEGHYEARLPDQGGDELAELSRHLNHLALTLDQTEQSRRRWVADISHELRTPLAILRAQLDALEDGINTYNESSHHRLSQQTLRLQQLIDDLYQLSLADAGALHYKKQDHPAAALIKEACDAFAARFQQAALQFQLDLAPNLNVQLFVDEQRFHQLLANLLENSLRYTSAPGTVKLTAMRQQQHLIIKLEDSAPGLPSDQVEQLFERFYRGESSRNRATGGAGLGLNICRAIIHAHAGTISAKPSQLGGLCITIELPISSP